MLHPRYRLAVGLVWLTAGCGSSSGGTAPEVFTHPAGSVAGTRLLAGGPRGIAITRPGVAYVARSLADSLARVVLPDTAPSDSLAAGGRPLTVAANPAGTTLYVVDSTGAAVQVVIVDLNKIVAAVQLTNSGLSGIVGPGGSRVYVTTADGRVYVIDAGSNTIVDSMRAGSSANGVTLAPDGSKLYVTSRAAGTVTVFNTQNDVVLDTILIGGKPQQPVVAPDGGRLYVANEDSGLSVVNLPAGTLAPSVSPTGSGYGLGLTPDGTQLYLINADSGKVTILDRATLGVVKTLDVGGQPRNVAFSHLGETAVITDGGGRLIFVH